MRNKVNSPFTGTEHDGRCQPVASTRDEAISRLYGGIHYRGDIEGGKTHVTPIGSYAVQFAQQDLAN